MSKEKLKLGLVFCLLITAVKSSNESDDDLPQPEALTGVGGSAGGNSVSPSSSIWSDYWTTMLNVTYFDPNTGVWNSVRTESARFSTTGSVHDVDGRAVEIISADDDNDNTGCHGPFRQNYPPPDEPWIAVVRRGKCTFNQKIANAIKLNASGVLVYDNENVPVLQSMKVEWYKIPSVFTFNWKGKEIVQLIRNYDDVFIGFSKGSHCRTETMNRLSAASFGNDVSGFNDDDPTSSATATSSSSVTKLLYCIPPDTWNGFQDIFKKQAPFWNWNITGGVRSDSYNVEKKTSVLFVSVSFIVLMLISLAWLVFYYVQRFRYIHAKDRLERKLCSQAKRALAIISTSVLKKDELKDDTCAVCIENYRVADVVRILPCKHQFHKSCIDQWLLEKRTCPMCKMDILKFYGLVDETTPEEEAMSLNIA